jgi:hypothetical protein
MPDEKKPAPPAPAPGDILAHARDARLQPQTSHLPAAQSEFTDLLTAAMCRARPKFKAIKKNAKGNFGPYATLDEVLDSVTPALAAEGLDLRTKQQVIGDQEWVVTTLSHASGQFERSFNVIRSNPAKPQEMLSWVTYYRRMHVASLCGVAADSDLDGAGLEGGKAAKKPVAATLARSALLGAPTEQARDSVLAKAAMSVAAGRMTEEEMLEIKDLRESLRPVEEAAVANSQ